MEEDLLVTNAFYPIAVLTENGNQQSTRVDFNFRRNAEMPYKTEQLGPYPEIKLKDEKRYDTKTANEFRQYLKKKEKISDPLDVNTNAEYMDTMMERGNMPKYYENNDADRRLHIKKIIINFDSRTRDTELYPNAYDYSVFLPFKIQNIKYVEMISSEIPYTATTGFPYFFICSKSLTEIEKFQRVENIFAKVQLDATPSPTTVIFDGHIDHSLTVFDTTPLDHLVSVDFQFRNPDNSFYDVGDHSFTLEFIVYIDTIMNSNFSSRRGIQDKTNLESNLLL
jgi:hypothetical protein